MSQHPLLELSDRLRKLKSEGLVDCVEILQRELDAQDSLEEKLGVYAMLAVELQSQERFDEAERVIRKRISLAPEIPDAWIALALHFLYHTKEPEKALSAIDTAVEKSLPRKEFFRQAHLERIRIALALKSYSLIEESLIQLVNYTPSIGAVDSRLETEFLDMIPSGASDPQLIESYRAKAKAEAERVPVTPDVLRG